MKPSPYQLLDGLALFRFGAGDPLLLLPDPAGIEVIGDDGLAALVTGLTGLGRCVLTFDPPGVGQSTRPPDLTLEEMFSGAATALEATGVSPPVDVLGHGQGALVALAWAIERPDRVRRLILIGGASGGPAYLPAGGAIWNLSHPYYWPYTLAALSYRLTRRRIVEKLMLNVVRRVSFTDPGRAATERIAWRDLPRGTRPRTAWERRVARSLDYSRRLAAVEAPTLLFTGRHDPLMPPECAEELAGGIPQARLIIFERSGHYPFLEEPEAFWAAVAEFLAASDGPSAGNP